ncbi:MAG: four-carbon acid sugar kinase family protein [Clostridiaceae bacterium]|nr:four-carbon acid sugar kinase family protein [Clostridiaceae bacterium]
MRRMVLIADDLTGALDTGVQFAGSEASVFVTTADRIKGEESADILVVDTESRHLPAEEAYKTVYEAVDCVRHRFPWIYKKTDSLLRGNLGAELTAVLDSSGRKKMVFVPSYPRMRRIVKNGRLFVDGVPATHAHNAKDALDPVATSVISDIIAKQTDLTVHLTNLAMEDFSISGEKEILVSDAVTDDDMHRIARRILPYMQDIAVAGCAGFASVLKEYAAPAAAAGTAAPEIDAQSHLIICGSINERTRRQINYAVEMGLPHLVLTPEEYIGEFHSDEIIRVICGMLRENGAVLVCTARDDKDMEKSGTYVKEHRLSADNLHISIAKRLGEITAKVINTVNVDVLSVIGGDTLFGIMSALDGRGFIPVREIRQGTVQSVMMLRPGGSKTILTKAGSFGDDDAIWHMYKSALSG